MTQDRKRPTGTHNPSASSLRRWDNEGGAPVYWMDILDWQIVRFLENLTFEPYPDEQQPALRSPGRDIYFPWTEAYAALQKRAQQEVDHFDDVLLEYVDPASGASLRPTVAC